MRIVSLVPSVTETLLAWDVTPIAVTRFCEHPELTQVGGTKDPDVAAIVALEPDLVVVCDEENRREDADALLAAGVAIHVMTVESVAAVDRELARLATAIGRAEPTARTSDPQGSGVVGWAVRQGRRRSASDEPTARTSDPQGSEFVSRRRAFVPIWRRPWMTLNAATYGSSLLASIGIDNVFADATERYPVVTLDEVRARVPDLVVAPSEPYPFGDRHRAELETVAPVELVDGQDVFWWGVRTPAARRRLSERLHGRAR